MDESRDSSFGGMKIWIALGIVGWLLYNCHGSPPVEMPYRTTDAYEIKTLSSDYEVSRFWACSWAGGCPLEEWDYCLKITPKDPIAALLWYSRTTSRYRDVARDLMEGSGSVDWHLSAAGNLESRVARAKRDRLSHEREAELVREIRKIQANERAALDSIMERTRDGLLVTATYQKIGDKTRSGGWFISAGCDD